MGQQSKAKRDALKSRGITVERHGTRPPAHARTKKKARVRNRPKSTEALTSSGEPRQSDKIEELVSYLRTVNK